MTEAEKAFAVEKHLELKREAMCFQAVYPGPIEYRRGHTFAGAIAGPRTMPRKALLSDEKSEKQRRYQREYYRKWRGVPKALRCLP